MSGPFLVQVAPKRGSARVLRATSGRTSTPRPLGRRDRLGGRRKAAGQKVAARFPWEVGGVIGGCVLGRLPDRGSGCVSFPRRERP